MFTSVYTTVRNAISCIVALSGRPAAPRSRPSMYMEGLLVFTTLSVYYSMCLPHVFTTLNRCIAWITCHHNWGWVKAESHVGRNNVQAIPAMVCQSLCKGCCGRMASGWMRYVLAAGIHHYKYWYWWNLNDNWLLINIRDLWYLIDNWFLMNWL